MKKILIINGHSIAGSFSDALFDAYVQGAKEGGHEVVAIRLRDLQFDPILRQKPMPLEPDMIAMQRHLVWADHLVIVSPVWWFGSPALLKGFFDRVLTPGFAYKYRGNTWYPEIVPRRLLRGRSARVVFTHDAFKIVMAGLSHPYWRAMKWATLWYVGFSPVKKTSFGRVFRSTEGQRKHWLESVKRLGKEGK